MAALVQVLLLGLMVVIFLAGVINLLVGSEDTPWQIILLLFAIFILIIWFPLMLLRRGYFQASVMLIVGILFSLETYAVLSTHLRLIAETLLFFTLGIILAGSTINRRALLLTFLLSSSAVVLGAARESDSVLREDSLVIASNFILLNGLISLFIDRFGINLRTALRAAMERENKLAVEVQIRHDTEAALQKSTTRLSILHEIDRALLAAHTLRQIADDALIRIRLLIPCPRASLTLLDVKNREATFLAASFHEPVTFPSTPINFDEFGQRIIDKMQQNQVWTVSNVLEDPEATELDKRLAVEKGIHAWLAVPLLAQGRLIGALNLGRGIGESFTDDEVEIARDIADQLAIAMHQTNLNNALQKELAERKKLISQLEASNEELERFTYTVSHDLRNPLVTIKGFLGMLDKDLHENKPERVALDFQRISNAADKMQALLANLLDLSRIGRIADPPTEVHLTEIALEAVETLDARIRSKTIQINIASGLPTLIGDRVRLREVFENLIDNAAKYMGNQEDPRIEIGVRDESIIFVKDNGLGIDPSYTTRIFGLFEKLDPHSEGTGIGLALIKRIIEVHGGKIWVESEGLGKGSTFCFTFPGIKN